MHDMTKMVNIVKLEAHNANGLCMIYDMIKGSCDSYEYLTRSIFQECRNSIYVCAEFNALGLASNIYGFVGVRSTTMEELGIESLEYYCQPDRRLYSIEFLHYMYHGSTPYPPEFANDEVVYRKLLTESLADKNDGFAVFRPHCPTGQTPEQHNHLINFGFKLYNYDPRKEVYTYAKAPTVRDTKHSWRYEDNILDNKIPLVTTDDIENFAIEHNL